jgi:hypothetical protein
MRFRNNVAQYDILGKWEKFKKEFYRVHNNILEANLMKDIMLTIDERMIAEVVFCDEKRQELEDRLDNVKVKECVDFPGKLK